MSERKHGWFVGFFVGLWALINFARRLIVNIIFIVIVVLFVMAVRNSGPKVEDHTALVLDPKGNIVEQYTADAAQRTFGGLFGQKVREVQLRDILRAIDAATHDARIERIVIEPDEIEGAGLSTLREIGAALDRFKAAGKEDLTVPAGRFDAVRVDRTDADRGFSAWYAPDRYPLPVKLSQKDGGNLTMELVSFR